jgi:hypothetical protein
MAKPHKLKLLQKEYGDLHEVIPPLVNLYGQSEAARRLGLSIGTVSTWLSINGYRQVVRYVRPESDEDHTQLVEAVE